MPDETFRSLETDRLILRPFVDDDLLAFVAYRSDPDTARYQSWDPTFSLEDGRHFLDGLRGTRPDTPGEWFQFAIADRATDQLLGDCAAHPEADDPRVVKVGYTLAPEHQGRGYATEAVRRLLDYLFLERDKHRVYATCDVRNEPSIALLERLGMRREAHHLEDTWSKGEWCSGFTYAVLAREWRR